MGKAKNKTVEEVKEETVKEVVKPTDEELILGASPGIKVVKVVDYTSYKRNYKVTNTIKNRVYTLNGYQIGAILGMNQEARKQLKEGVKKVTINNDEGQALYKIEVL